MADHPTVVPLLRWASLILLLGLGIRLTAAVAWQARLPEGQHFAFPDSESYWHLSRTIAKGQPYQYGDAEHRIFRSPGYPLLLAPLFLVYPDASPVLSARALGAFCGTAAIALTMLLANVGISRWLAGAIAVLYPGAILTSILVLAESPFCVCMLLQLYLWQRYLFDQQPPHWSRWIIVGTLAGMATLVRPSWLLFTPFALGVLWLLPATRARTFRGGLAVLIGLTVVQMPWWYRNAEVTGHFVATTLQSGASLYDGLNPDATGASDMRFVPTARERFLQSPEQHVAGAPMEYAFDRWLGSQAIRWAAAHPLRTAHLATVKFRRMWNPWPNEPSLNRLGTRFLVGLPFTIIMVGATCFVIRNRRDPRIVLLLLPAAYFTLLHVIFVGSIRYRQPAMLPLIALAANAIAPWLAGRFAGRSREPAHACAANSRN